MTDPLVQVWPDRYVNGILSVEGPHLDNKGRHFTPQLGELTTLRDALDREHGTNAMVTTYAVLETDEDSGGKAFVPSPLIRKAALKSVRAHGGDIMLTCIGIDIDTPAHAPLSEEFLADTAIAIASLPAPFDQWHSWYTSRHGLRVFYALTEPLPVDDAEPRVLTFLRALREHGIAADEACKDWTRRFLLPKVARDGTRTVNDTLFTLTIAEGSPSVDLSAFSKAPANILARQISFERRERYPAQDECAARLTEISPKGRPVASRFLNAARKVLKAWPHYYEQLITQHDPLPDEDRHNYMITMFGVIVPPLIRRAGARAEDIFALVYDPILAWDPATLKADPHANVWDALQHVYQIEAAKYNEEQKDKAEKAEEGLTHMQAMIRGMRTWCPDPQLAAGVREEASTSFVMRHLFANIEKQFFPMGRYGEYEQSSISRDQIITHIRNGFLNEIVPTETPDGTVPAAKIVDSHSTIVHYVEYLPECKEMGIKRMDSPTATLYLPMYRRNPHLTACYNAEVDGWLKALFHDHYKTACEWIGYALAFDECTVCALSIKGHPDIGKKLLIVGLSECLEIPYFIPGETLDATHNEAMLKSPFLHVNETWPMMRNHPSSSDRFKQLVGGDPIHVNPKFKTPVMVKNPLRILITANNHDALHDMIRGRNIRPCDREAIGQRLYHLDTDREAAYYLRSLGGHAYTSRPGARWIGGDSGQVSDCIVARHFLWLYENRPPIPIVKDGDGSVSKRMAVMGNSGGTDTGMFQAAAQGASLPMVMRGVLEMCRSPKTYPNDLIMGKGTAWVTMGGLYNIITKDMEERLSERALEEAVESLSRETDPLVYDDGRHFTEINMELVLDYAGRWGLDTRKAREGMGL